MADADRQIDRQIDRLRIDDRQRAVREDRGWGRWLVAGLVVALVAAAAWWWMQPGPVAVDAVRPQPIETTNGTARASVLDASGYVVARRQATVAAEVTGKLIEVDVEEGMRVEAGQVLARLDDATEQAQLALSRARLRAAEAALTELEVLRDDARRTLGRQRELNDRNLASQADLDRAETELRSFEARLASGREQVLVARREVAVQEQRIDELTVRAPFGGIVIARAAQAGEMVSPISAGGGFTRTGICTIVDMDSLEIEVDVNESYIDRVRAGQPVTARLDAYPDLEIPAEVTTVVPAADRQKATVRVRIGFLERDPRILPDMGISVRFLEPEAPQSVDGDRDVDGSAATVASWSLPASAVFEAGDRRYVWRIDGNTVQRRAVRTGATRDDRVIVLGGLAASDRVVADASADGLDDGARVELRQ